MKVTMQIDGLKDLELALTEMPKSTARTTLRRAGMAALEPMRQAAVRMAPDDPTTPPPFDLKSSIATSFKQGRSKNVITTKNEDTRVYVFMGPGFSKAMSKEQQANLAQYSMAQEFGSKPHSIAKGSRKLNRSKARKILGLKGPKMHPGHQAHPYMRPAFDAYARTALEIVTKTLQSEIERSAQRLARKAARLAAKG